MLRGLTFCSFAILLALALAGCGARSQLPAASPASAPEYPVPPGLPDYAFRSALAVKGYSIAFAEQELLSRLPCYCGCGQDSKYKHLRDCFINDQGEFQSHGANCEVCLEEARDAAAWKVEGLSEKEIRARIDAEYEGRGKPTDTPPVD